MHTRGEGGTPPPPRTPPPQGTRAGPATLSTLLLQHDRTCSSFQVKLDTQYKHRILSPVLLPDRTQLTYLQRNRKNSVMSEYVFHA